MEGIVVQRKDGRESNQVRDIKVTPNYIKYPEGSVLIEVGSTKVICNVTVQDGVPSFLKGKGQGWLTAEYSMLPRATDSRTIRESVRGKLGGRTMEIQRLIGRSLRSAINLKKIGERTIIVDCDVIQADGGTRTTSITGSYIALAIAVENCIKKKRFKENPLFGNIASTSVGIVNGKVLLDLNYSEDSIADVDMNVVMNHEGEFIEIQGTGEEATFSRQELNNMLEYAEEGIRRLFEIQNEIIESVKTDA